MGTVIWPKNNAYYGKTREEILSALQAALMGRCESAWLFGSFARNEERPGSDLDLIVVKNTERPFLERAREFDDLWSIFPALDLLVYTPKEFAALQQEEARGFHRTIAIQKIRLL